MTDKTDQLLKPQGRELEIIEFNGLSVRIIRSARRKTLSLEVGHGGVKARAPQRMRAQTIQQFIVGKESWIRQHLANLPVIATPLPLHDGSKLLILGECYRLLTARGRKPVYLDGMAQIVVPVVASHLPWEQSVRRKLIKWYKQVAMRHLQLRVTNRLSMMLPESKPPAIKVRDYKRRWGSCDHRGHLSFNWRIVMAPESVLDYVVIHELAHLTEFNHSRRFWRIVEQQMPEWKVQQKWLSENGSSLYRF